MRLTVIPIGTVLEELEIKERTERIETTAVRILRRVLEDLRKLTMMPIVISALGTIPKGLVKGLNTKKCHGDFLTLRLQ